MALSYRSLNTLRRTSAAARPMVAGRKQVQVRAMASTAQKFVLDNIEKNKVVVFSKSHCPYCSKAKQALGSLLPKEKFAVFEIETMPEMDMIQDTLLGITGGRSVPRVFIDGKFIGGGDDTARLAASGELKKMLEAAGAL